MNIQSNLKELEIQINYTFKDFSLLTNALTHTSYANEHKREGIKHNERLEFLGDAVLELISSQFLFELYPDLPEGELTKKRASMVCEPALAYCGRAFQIETYLILGKGEEHTGGRKRDSIVSDAVEALIGAIYLDGGFASAKEFIANYILNDLENKELFYDSKTILQELIQGKSKEELHYELLKEEGPDHNKTFTVLVYVGSTVLGRGEGRTKKAAEQKAAYEAIKIIRNK